MVNVQMQQFPLFAKRRLHLIVDKVNAKVNSKINAKVIAILCVETLLPRLIEL